jgi:aminopeptidase N
MKQPSIASQRNMKKIIILFLSIYINCFTTQAQSDSTKLPTLQLPRERKIDVKHIALDLRFDWAKKQAYGKATFSFSMLKTADKIALDAGMLTINSISLLNGKALIFNYDGGDKNDGLEIMLDRVYQLNEEITLVIDYHTNWINEVDPYSLSGSNGKGLRFSQPTFNDPIKPYEIWSIGEPQSNRYWFPCYDHPNDLRTTEFTTTLDKKFHVISNGKRDVKINPDGTHTTHWKMDTPYANHLTSFVIGEYLDVQENYEGFMLHNYGAAKEMDWVAASTERLSDMMSYFTKVTETKYPFDNYTQVFVQDIGSYTSNSGLSTITENMIDDKTTHADYFYLWDLTEAEALAQQWFGNYMTAADWSDVWLNKSFAHYLNELYNLQKNGNDEYLLFQHSYDQSVYLNDWNANYRHPVVTQNYDDVLSFTSDNYAGIRGALVLNMLKKQLDDDVWWKAVRIYTKENAGKLVTTKNFVNAVEQASGQKMDWFFDQWLYEMGHPVFTVTKNYDATKKELTLHVKQIQKVDADNAYPQAEFFKGHIDIEIDGNIEKVWLEAKAQNSFTFSCTQQPKLVNFDYESTWIKEVNFEKTFDELLYQFKYSKDILARQTAMMELAKIAKDEKTSVDIKNKIKTELRNTVSGQNYWRFKNLALGQLRSIIGAEKLDEATIAMLLSVIKTNKSWLKASAIGFLGSTKDVKYVPIYLTALNDVSDRVISSAAVALGKTKSPKAFDALQKLATKPSMKSQSMLSALSGLKELGDVRGYDIAYKALSDLQLPRWRLPDGSVWDFRIFAAQTIASLGKSDDAYSMVLEQLKKSMNENDLNGVFNSVLVINALASPKAQEAYELLKMKFKDDTSILAAVNYYETQLKETIK